MAAAIGCLTLAVPAPATATSAKHCVGLFVDGTSIGGTRASGCVQVASGSTGVTVLEAAGDKLVTEYNGDFVCSINGLPASGCGGVDGTHFWSYWHRAPGATTWSYSSEGAGSYEPVAGSSEGWVYDDGKQLSPTGVGRLCPVPATTGATPSPSVSTHPTASPTPAVRESTSTPTSSPSASAVIAKTSSSPKPRKALRSKQNRQAEGTPSRSLTPRPGAQPNPTDVSGSGSPWGVIVGLSIAAVLAGAAIWQSRRGRRS